MEYLKGQHVCIKVCFKPRKNATHTFYKLKVDFGEYKMGRTLVLDSGSKFKSGVSSAEHAEDSERPPMNKIDENVNRMKELVLENRRITIREVADTLETSSGSICYRVSTQMQLKQIYHISGQSVSRQCSYAPDCRQIRLTC